MKPKVVLIIKEHSTRGQIMGELRTLGIAYVEAPDLREALKRADPEWKYSLICYDPHGLGLENCHNYDVVLSSTESLRKNCGFPPLLLVDECFNEDNAQQFTESVVPFTEILGVCEFSSMTRVLNDWLQPEL